MANKIFLLPAEPSAATTPRRPPSSSNGAETPTPVQRSSHQRFIFTTPVAVTPASKVSHHSDPWPGPSPSTTPIPTKRPVFLLPNQQQQYNNVDPSPSSKPSTPHFLLPNTPSPAAFTAAALSTDLITEYGERLKNAEKKKNESEPLLAGGLAERMSIISARERSETIMWLHMNTSDDDERRAQRDLSLAMTVRVCSATREDPRMPGLQWATCEVLEMHDVHIAAEGVEIGFRAATDVYGLSGAEMPRVCEGDVVRVFDPVALNLPHRDTPTFLCIRYAVD
ncbi:hypothetical protein HDU87_005151 [Geranomyces variabilis]|uniref:Uncharacterized protein n=1 Tax=Geranomyces variabilis TaxID=109894 RepID=A0AAD5TTK4_9FUNG|nr:hypothetical protein HDU87_005151 [Geranomyces variabilis]